MTAADEPFFSHASSVAKYGNEKTILQVGLPGPALSASIHLGHSRHHTAEEGLSHCALSELLIHSIFEHNKMFIDIMPLSYGVACYSLIGTEAA